MLDYFNYASLLEFENVRAFCRRGFTLNLKNLQNVYQDHKMFASTLKRSIPIGETRNEKKSCIFKRDYLLYKIISEKKNTRNENSSTGYKCILIRGLIERNSAHNFCKADILNPAFIMISQYNIANIIISV